MAIGRMSRYFIALLLMAGVFAGWGGGAVTLAQQVSDAVQQKAQADFFGDDPDTKDGPLAKVGQDLAELYHSYDRHQKQAPAEPYQAHGLFTVRDGAVVVDATAHESADALRADLEALGLRRSAQAGRVVSGLLPIESIPEAAELETLLSLRPAVVAPQRRAVSSGTVTSEGDAAMRADVARDEANVDGSGTTVGVLSDSYDADPAAATSASDDISSGDLPPDNRINILQDLQEGEGTDEGRAMMQIIHDVAPGASLAFHTAVIGQAGFAEGIEALVEEANSDILVDDILFLNEPMFQDGIIAQAADASVREGGAAYFSSAGNSGLDSFESGFNPSGEPGVLSPQRAELHDFGGGDTFQEIIVPEGDSLRLTFQWTDAYASAGGAGADSELDIFLLDDSGEVVAQSNFPNRDRDPVEILSFANDGSFDSDRFHLGIELFAGPPPETIKYVDFSSIGVGIEIEDEDALGEPTLFGHANARHAAAVGAAFWANTPAFNPDVEAPLVNSFSAVGGVPITFDRDGIEKPVPEVRDKPNITAPDGVATTFFGEDATNDDRRNFFGTSAAAPHAAAVGALMLDFDSRRSPAQLYRDLEATAEDITRAWDLSEGEFVDRPLKEGFDVTSGHGFVRADRAVSIETEVFAFDAELTGGNAIEISWEVDEDAQIESFALKEQLFSDEFETIEEVDAAEGPEFSVTIERPLGRYTYRLQGADEEGESVPVPGEPTVDVDLLSLDAQVEDEDVSLSWEVPPASEEYTFDVQQRSGDRGFRTVNDEPIEQTSFVIEDLRPGAYDFRLRMEDEEGNAFASQQVASSTVDQPDLLAIDEPYPNPFTDRVRFDVTAEEATLLNVRVYNAIGEIVKLRGVRLDAQVPRTITVEPQSNWSSGVYYVQFFDQDRREVTSRQAVFVR